MTNRALRAVSGRHVLLTTGMMVTDEVSHLHGVPSPGQQGRQIQ